MSTYRVATGHDVALGSLTVLNPQPDPGGAIQTTRRTYGGDGSVTDEAQFFEFTWSGISTASGYATLLSTFGLNASTAYANVTIYVRNEIYSFVSKNGIAHRPMPQRDVKTGAPLEFPQDITILVTDLAEINPA